MTNTPALDGKKPWQSPRCGRLGMAMTETGSGNTVERFCVQNASSSQCPGGGPPYPQAYSQNTGNHSPGCPGFVMGNNTASKCMVAT